MNLAIFLVPAPILELYREITPNGTFLIACRLIGLIEHSVLPRGIASLTPCPSPFTLFGAVL